MDQRMADRLREAVGVMLDRADELGVTRKAIAMKVGIDYYTLAAYSQASQPANMPATRLLQLLLADYVPVLARVAALSRTPRLGLEPRTYRLTANVRWA